MIQASDKLQEEAMRRIEETARREKDKRLQAQYRQDLAQNHAAATMQRVRYGAQEKADAYWEAGR